MMTATKSKLFAAARTRVMIVTRGLGIGGAEIVVRDLARTIDRSRFELSICCLKGLGPIGEELAAEGIDISVLPNVDPSRPDYFTSIKLRRLIRQKRINILHSHDTNALVDTALCRCATPGLKAVHTFHFGNYPNKGERILWMERIFSRLVDQLIAVGEAQKEQIKAAHRLPDGAIAVVRNGVALGTNQCDNSFRSRVGVGNRILIGTIATFIKQKGLQDLLAVAMQFKGAGVHFVVVGDGPLRSELEAKRREFGLEDTVTFTGSVMNAAEVVLPAFDVFFQPSLWEAMSIVILEAMAAGKPVVATRVGENALIIKDEVDGLLVQPKDVKGMAASLCRLIDDAELRCRLGNAAAQKVARQFTVERMTRAYEEIYLGMVR